jgi:glucose/arabinose dehydrogenase
MEMSTLLVLVTKTSKLVTAMVTACFMLASPYAEAIDLQFTLVVDIFGVVDIRNAGDGTGRLFLVTKDLGQVHILKDGSLLNNPFLDIGDRITSPPGGEQGLLSLAFAPDYGTSGLFYVWYTDQNGDTTLSRFSVSDDPDLADADSEEKLLVISQPFENHNGGRLLFGPDGMLYLSTGDGGNTDGDLRGNGQALDTLLGKIIRIDVNPVFDPYGIPPDNPFINNGQAMNEIWASGLRNPWRMSFDRLNGDLYIADVGQGRLEEINLQPASSTGGENYGWNIMEGSECFRAAECSQTELTLPVAEYRHVRGMECSVIGGEVYRGSAYPDLIGVYLYGDWCSGRIWGLSRIGDNWKVEILANTAFRYETGNTILTFGEGEDGSVYLSNKIGVILISDGEVVAEPNFTINAGHSGAWFNPETSGQGQLIDVEPASQFMFVSWFTHTDAASANPFEQRWFTAQGNYSGNTAELPLFETLGGKFDDPQMVTTTQVGEVTVSFSDCGQGQMTYSLDEEGLQGEFPLLRVIPGSENVCEDLAGTSPQAVDINAGMDGAWFDPATSGQGYFIDAHPDPEGGNFIFVSWFTYGDETASGQRWLTAQGGFEGSLAEIDVFETTGGSFDDPLTPSTVRVGTMSLDFTDCSNAQLSYSLPADPAEGDIAITRVIPGGQVLCEELAGED